jgi:hypothetical protein
MGDGESQRRGAVAAHAAGEFVADLDTSAANHVRILDRDHVLLQGRHRFGIFHVEPGG